VIAGDIVSSLTKSISVLIQSQASSDTILEQVPEKQEHEIDVDKHYATSCEHCPIVWFNRVCQTIEGLSEKKTFSTIVRFIETMSDEDQDVIMQKFYGIENIMDYSTKDKNEHLLTFLEAQCQLRQKTHIHDTPENRSEFLNHYLGGSTIFTKAKKSLTNSFDHLLKRRSSKDMVDHPEELSRPKITRSFSLTPQFAQTQTFKKDDKIEEEAEKITSPKMDMLVLLSQLL
jgi:TBC1 domain-containing protein 4